ncbi:hypothetical protein LY76DRAFT_685125 [Colletotrichum caudatum]|nr:hypothetical protein LY76DRAFT_685125 [Colletotrichum caudatum]
MTPPRVIAFAGNSLPLEAIGPPSFSMPSILSFLAKTFQSTLGISTRHTCHAASDYEHQKHLAALLSQEHSHLKTDCCRWGPWQTPSEPHRTAPHHTTRSLACMGYFCYFPSFPPSVDPCSPPIEKQGTQRYTRTPECVEAQELVSRHSGSLMPEVNVHSQVPHGGQLSPPLSPMR